MLAGALLMLFFNWNVAQRARSKLKPILKSINGVRASTIDYSLFSVIAGSIVEILFMLFFISDGQKNE